MRAFFEGIAQLGESYSGNDPVAHLSDKYGIKFGGKCLEEAILSLLPKIVSVGYRAAKHFAIRDISK